MYFSSLAVLTALACATFSVAAPLTPPVVDGLTGKIENTIDHVPRDVPTTAVSPLVIALTGLSTDLKPALAALGIFIPFFPSINKNAK